MKSIQLPDPRRRHIQTESLAEALPTDRTPVNIPYQADSVLFGGWGVKL